MRGSINFFGPKREGEDEEAKESKGFFNKSNGSIRFRMKLGNPRVVLKKENYLCREPIHILPNTQNLCRTISQRKALLASEIKFLLKKDVISGMWLSGFSHRWLPIERIVLLVKIYIIDIISSISGK